MSFAKIVAGKSKQKENAPGSQKEKAQAEANLRPLNTFGSNPVRVPPKPPGKKSSLIKKFHKLSQKLSGLTIHEEVETLEQRKARIKKMIEKFESPFIWKPVGDKFSTKKDTLLTRLQTKDDEIVDEKNFKWRNFILRLVMSYEHYCCDRLAEALAVVLELEKVLIDNSDNLEWLFLGTKNALWHVITTSKAFMYLVLDRLDEAEKCANEVQPVKTMRSAAKAGICGIKAAVFMEFGHKGNENALQAAKMALEIDKTCAEWHFLVGKCLGRIRRVAECFELVTPLETGSFNKAVKLEPDNPVYIVHLAQATRENNFRQYKKNYPKARSAECKKIDKGFMASYHMYLKAIELRPNCPHILTRCAYGLMKFPIRFIDIEKTRQYLLKAVEIAPNNMMAHHILGLFYERYDLDLVKAIKEIEIAESLGNFGAAMDLIRIGFLLKKDCDFVRELVNAAELYAEPLLVQEAYTQAGSYLLFIQFDIVGAVTFFSKVAEIDLDSYAMKVHKPTFLCLKDPVNLFEVLLEELDKNTDMNSFSREDKIVLRKFRIQILKHDNSENIDGRLTVDKIRRLAQKRKDRFKQRMNNESVKKRWRGNNRRFVRYLTEKKKEGNDKKLIDTNNTESHTRKSRSRDRAESPSESDRHRSRSRSSVSSVDSDYERSNYFLTPRGFFNNEDAMDGSTSDSRGLEPKDGTRKFSLHMNRYKKASNEHSLTESSFGRPSLFPNMSVSKSDIDHDEFRPRSASQSSISSVESSNSSVSSMDLSAAELLQLRRGGTSQVKSSWIADRTVMDKVKESYKMLKRTSIVQDENKKLQRSGSFTNVNSNKLNNTITRTDSTQSLNVQVASLTSNMERFKPFTSHSSFSFMPNFGNQDK